MKQWPVIALLLAVVAAVRGGCLPCLEASIMATPSLCRDSNNISSHVYNPCRLQTFKDCTATSSIIDNLIVENDGDYHIWFHVDPRFANLLNSANNDYRQGDLLAEIICTTAVNRQNAILACENYANQIPMPSVNQNITVAVTIRFSTMTTDGWKSIQSILLEP